MIRKSKVILMLVLGLVVTSFVAHLLITRPTDVKQFFYPIEAKIAGIESRCSVKAPKWLHYLLQTSLQSRGSLANQIAYIDTAGGLHHCESGWSGRLLFSEPVVQTDRYRYASITKILTADLILRLIDENRLKLDTKLVEIFPEIKPARDDRINDITISNLLNHTAGFDRNTLSGDIMFWSAKKNWCPYQLERMSKEKLAFTPGEKQVYSNLGYCLLGAIIQKTTGLRYRDYAEKIYRLSQYNIKFIDGPYLSDEVKYDFRNDYFYTEGYYKGFDFDANEAVVGASGSAIGLARVVEYIASRSELDLFSSSVYKNCNLKEVDKCYGNAFNHYRPENTNLRLFTHSGYLPGSSSILVVDDHGGILVLLNAGAPPDLFKSNQETVKLIYDFLKKEYKL
ncbi:MAG: beta-lactamase family protein [Cellvibrio sp.]|nr:beta-lactamase family protein [Cellvibrio sp.]